MGPNHFGQVQIIKISQEKYNSNLTKIIWTCQNNLDLTKTIWTVQNHFGHIEGQDLCTKQGNSSIFEPKI